MPAAKYHAEVIEQALSLREQGATYAEITERTGMARSSVYWHCLRKGADSPQSGAHMRKHARGRRKAVVQRSGYPVRRFTPEEDRQIIAMEAAGASLREIGRALGRRHNSVLGRLATLARRQALQEDAA